MSYDYIIIGAGSAGCLLANRLSKNPENTVLLLEAGGPDSKIDIHVPAGYSKLHRSKVDWGYWTEPQKHILNRKLYVPRGKVLGGCSSTNAMAYVRGNKEDYNDWAAFGNKGWSYEEILPYFKKSEANEDFTNEYHGTKGELNVGFPKRFKSPFRDAFVKSCVEQGFSLNHDYNGEQQEGAGHTQFTIKEGWRHSAVKAFLKPVMKRKNLTVITRAHTKRILIENDRAVGVEVGNKENSSTIYKAKKEVILSAGAIGSPQLLLLSGVGDKDELKQLGIECKQNLPGVGKNYQDHLFLGVSALSHQQEGQNHYVKPWNQIKEIAKFLIQRKGAMTIGPLEGMAFGSTTLSPDRVDYQLHFTSFQVGEDYEANIYDMSTYPTEDGFAVCPTLLRPKSRGSLALRSKNPFDHPILQPNFLEAEEDRQVLLEVTKKAIAIVESQSFSPYLKKIGIPAARSTDEEIYLHIQNMVETIYHPVGSCKMGSDDMAVVDDELRVHNVQGLRVIDASIMPTIVSGNTNAPTYMIAEKGADLVLGK